MDEHEAQLVADIDRFGWTVMKVSNDAGPNFAYSIGIFQTLKHPEIIMFGLALDTMHTIINDVGEHVRKGARFEAGATSSDFLEDFDVTFRTVPRHQYAGHLGWATWLYHGEEFPVLQLVYPDRERRWPWSDGATDGFRALQPVLADSGDLPWTK
jgi:hypothetical protein